MARSRFWPAVAWGMLLPVCGCHQWFINRADREVYDLIESRQQAALGETHPVRIDEETGHTRRSGDPYRFAPHPVDSAVPDPFREATTPRPKGADTPPTTPSADLPGHSAGVSAERSDYPQDPLATQPAVDPDDPEGEPPADADTISFTLADSLAYGQRHSREFQTAKEDLYLSALALSLERFLWTPQLSSSLSYEFADYGQVRDFDRAMTATATLAAEQRLPLGGTVTAQVIDRWMRDLKVHTTSGETGQVILAADIPLLRGAGRVAYESRYQAERDLIYAVRTFERFRRAFVVDIAADYFNLLSLRDQIESAKAQARSLQEAWERAQALASAGPEEELKGTWLDADRAGVQYRSARNNILAARERYETALDQFKIRLGMDTVTPLALSETAVELYEPTITETEADEAALHYRLDLLNRLDEIDDARRGVEVARNNLLPDLDFTGSVTMDSDPNHPNVTSYNTERTTWRGLLELEVPLNRQAERNEFRSALIDLRRAERRYDQRQDEIRAEVRRTQRQIALARVSLEIQRENVAVGQRRALRAQAIYEAGRPGSTIRDIIEAENELLNARNTFANAQADYRTRILEFLLATGTLRVDDDGHWATYHQVPGSDPQTPPRTAE